MDLALVDLTPEFASLKQAAVLLRYGKRSMRCDSTALVLGNCGQIIGKMLFSILSRRVSERRGDILGSAFPDKYSANITPLASVQHAGKYFPLRNNMKTVSCFFLAILASSLILAADIEKQQPENQMVKLNMGGCKIDISLDILEESGSEFFDVLLSKKFKQNDRKKRIYIGCSHDVARVMLNYLCHRYVSKHDIDTAYVAADFFVCNGLKDLLKETNLKESFWKWRKFQIFAEEESLRKDICPLCSQEIEFGARKSKRDIGNILAHLIISHESQIQSIQRMAISPGYNTLIKYRFDQCQRADDSQYSARIGTFSIANWCFDCFVPGCTSKLCSVKVQGQKSSEEIQMHLTDKHDAKTLFVGDEIILFIYPNEQAPNY